MHLSIGQMLTQNVQGSQFKPQCQGGGKQNEPLLHHDSTVILLLLTFKVDISCVLFFYKELFPTEGQAEIFRKYLL